MGQSVYFTEAATQTSNCTDGLLIMDRGLCISNDTKASRL